MAKTRERQHGTGLLVSRRNGIIDCEQGVLTSVPAGFRFPFPSLAGWKTQDLPPREGRRKRKTATRQTGSYLPGKCIWAAAKDPGGYFSGGRNSNKKGDGAPGYEGRWQRQV